MATLEEVSIIPIEILIDYYKAGLKLIPLSKDARNPNVTGLLTHGEEIISRDESPDGQIHPVNFIYNHPDFWDENRIKKENWRFNNVATTFGKTHINDDQGRQLYLNVLDIDSKSVFDELAIIKIKDKDHYFIDEICKITFVTKTKKMWGRHIYWFSHEQNQPLRSKDFKLGYECEIKTDNSAGLITLPPSIHRDDPAFRYQAIGQKSIVIRDNLYNGILTVLSDTLRHNKNNNEPRKSHYYIRNAVNIFLSDADTTEIVSQIAQSYQKCSRDIIIYGLSGYLFKNNVNLESAEELVKVLCRSTSDEEYNNRINVLRNTYSKGQNGSQIAGYSYLRDILIRVSNVQTASTILENISTILNRHSNPIFSQLDNTVIHELSKHSFEIVSYTPVNFVIAHSEKKQILSGTINTTKVTEDKEESKPIQYVQYGNVIINAMPNKITRYENPSTTETKYEIEFETPRGQVHKIEPKSIEGILSELRAKGLVYKLRIAEEAFPAILNAYERP